MDIDGKKAIVFGGTSGIGLSATQMLSDKGAHVIALSRNPDKLKNVPKNVTTKKMNVLDRDALEKFFQEVGEYDILVNSATGGARAVGPFLSMDLDGYKASFDKLWGYTNVVRYGTKFLKDNGNIVLVSGSPARKCRPGQIAISSVGGAVEAFARLIDFVIYEPADEPPSTAVSSTKSTVLVTFAIILAPLAGAVTIVSVVPETV